MIKGFWTNKFSVKFPKFYGLIQSCRKYISMVSCSFINNLKLDYFGKTKYKQNILCLILIPCWYFLDKNDLNQCFDKIILDQVFLNFTIHVYLYFNVLVYCVSSLVFSSLVIPCVYFIIIQFPFWIFLRTVHYMCIVWNQKLKQIHLGLANLLDLLQLANYRN